MSESIIAFTGRKGSGKDTVASMLSPHKWTNIKFADPIKNMCRELLRVQGLDDMFVEKYIGGDLKETPTPYLNGMTAREVQQTLGTEWGRMLVSESIWVDILKRRCAIIENVVITDARFPNEEIALKEMGATLIRVVRPNLLDNKFSDHPSETYIDKMNVDFEIINDGTIYELQGKFSKVLAKAGFAGEAMRLSAGL